MSCRPFLFLFDGCMLACCPFLLARDGRRSPSPRKPTRSLLVPTAAAASVQRTPRHGDFSVSTRARRRRDHGAVAFLGLAAAPSPSRFLDPDDPEQRLESNGRMQEQPFLYGAIWNLRAPGQISGSLAGPVQFLFCSFPNSDGDELGSVSRLLAQRLDRRRAGMPAGSRGACAGLVPSAATVLALPSDKSWPSVSSSADTLMTKITIASY